MGNASWSNSVDQVLLPFKHPAGPALLLVLLFQDHIQFHPERLWESRRLAGCFEVVWRAGKRICGSRCDYIQCSFVTILCNFYNFIFLCWSECQNFIEFSDPDDVLAISSRRWLLTCVLFPRGKWFKAMFRTPCKIYGNIFKTCSKHTYLETN